MTSPLALIIEDDPDHGDIFALSLQAAGFETEIIPDGNAALLRLAEVLPAVIVLDLHLPHLSGQDILRFIRADERLAKTRVMLVTADVFLPAHIREEAELVLFKPVSPIQLRDLAARLRPVS